MSKIILLLSLLIIIFLLIFGMVDPNNSIMWLASTSHPYTLLRLALAGLLAGLLFINPPSNAYLRSAVLILCLGLAGWSLSSTYQNEMQFLDSLALLQASAAASLVTLETEAKPAPALNLQRFSLHHLYNLVAQYAAQHSRPHMPLRG